MKSRLPRFSLRTLLITSLIGAVGMGYLGRELFSLRAHLLRREVALKYLQAKEIEVERSENFDHSNLESIIKWSDGISGFRIDRLTLNGHIDDGVLVAVNEFPEIRDLSIVCSDYTGRGMAPKLAAIHNIRNLQKLALDAEEPSTISSQDVNRLIADNQGLVHLFIGRVHTDDATVEEVSKLKRLEALSVYGDFLSNKRGDFSSCVALKQVIVTTVTDGDTEEELEVGLGGLASAAGLAYLRLNKGTITTAEMAQIGKMRSLRRLELDVLRKYPETLAANLSECVNLEYLYVPRLKMTKEHAAQLSGLQKLKELRVADNTAKEVLARFRQLKPNCKLTLLHSNGTVTFFKE